MNNKKLVADHTVADKFNDSFWFTDEWFLFLLDLSMVTYLCATGLVQVFFVQLHTDLTLNN